jgi:hypothetical protein
MAARRLLPSHHQHQHHQHQASLGKSSAGDGHFMFWVGGAVGITAFEAKVGLPSQFSVTMMPVAQVITTFCLTTVAYS